MRGLVLLILLGSLGFGALKQQGEHRLHMSEAAANRHIKYRVEPRCPYGSCAGCRDAEVNLKVVVAKSGAVREITVVRTPNPELGEAAKNAVRRWTYHRYLLNGSPVEYETYTTIRSWKCGT